MMMMDVLYVNRGGPVMITDSESFCEMYRQLGPAERRANGWLAREKSVDIRGADRHRLLAQRDEDHRADAREQADHSKDALAHRRLFHAIPMSMGLCFARRTARRRPRPDDIRSCVALHIVAVAEGTLSLRFTAYERWR